MKNNCCICNSLKSSTFYRKVDDYTLLKCKECNLVFLSEADFEVEDFIKDAQQTSDAKVEFWSVPELYDKYQEVFDHFFQQRLDRMDSLGLPLSKCLDVGIGYGFWANFLKEKRNTSIEGIDIESSAIQYCVDHYSLNAKLESFEKYDSNQKFDAIFMFDVLEHFKSPLEMLGKAKSMLSKDGFIYIQVPNVLGLKYPFGHGLGLPYHFWQFDHKNIKKLFKKADLEVLEYWTGNQGIIGEYERGGPTILTKSLWAISNFFKRGNRLQLIVKPIS